MRDSFTITERIKPNSFEFEFMSFREVASRLRDALLKGILKTNKRYKLIIKEV